MKNSEMKVGAIPKTAIIGSDSFTGKHLLSEYRKLYPDCIGTSKRKNTSNGSYFDLLNDEINSLKLFETGHKEAVVCAGITKLDRCENERSLAHKINVEATLKLFYDLKNEGVFPIFFSSDNVFDGAKKEGYVESDPPLSQNMAGKRFR